MHVCVETYQTGSCWRIHEAWKPCWWDREGLCNTNTHYTFKQWTPAH